MHEVIVIIIPGGCCFLVLHLVVGTKQVDHEIDAVVIHVLDQVVNAIVRCSRTMPLFTNRRRAAGNCQRNGVKAGIDIEIVLVVVVVIVLAIAAAATAEVVNGPRRAALGIVRLLHGSIHELLLALQGEVSVVGGINNSGWSC